MNTRTDMTDLLVPADEIERMTGYKRPSRQVRIEPESVEAFTGQGATMPGK